jgi:hypothetical protein
MSSARYDIDIPRAGGEVIQELWITRSRVDWLISRLGNGDDLVLHRTDEDAEDGVIYIADNSADWDFDEGGEAY